METCSKEYKDSSLAQLGVVVRKECNKPVYKDGLCKHHYDREYAKTLKHKDREGYRDATEEDFIKRDRLFYIKTLGSHGGYIYRNGMMYNFNMNKPTNLPANPELFRVRI